ncbi:hypothetical protein [Nocardia arthritidis]|uniref:Uncharacterized protein n=1 Tax=Nocardia arthritidis TaxID=228602 RepID=A0A6G9Y809_9NOCA|nr:hypothetical protein [Nocardia arthritidis]QIS09193.1 hypothetical protein F5544_06410 [Nocardia arthritidis]
MHPPSDQPLPADRARYGWRNWPWDKAAATANSAEAAGVQAYFDLHGYDFASDLLGTYLGNNREGYEYRISPANVQKILSSSAVKNTVQEQLDQIRTQAKNTALRDPTPSDPRGKLRAIGMRE